MTCRAVPGARRRRSPGPTRARGVDRGPRHGQARECAPHDVQKGGEERCTNRNSRRRTPRTGRGRARGTPRGLARVVGAGGRPVPRRRRGGRRPAHLGPRPRRGDADGRRPRRARPGRGALPALLRVVHGRDARRRDAAGAGRARRAGRGHRPHRAQRCARRAAALGHPRRRRLPRLLPGVPRRDARDRRGGGRRARRAHHVPGRRRDAPLPVRHRAGARRGVRAGRGQGARRLGPGGPARAGRRRHPPLRNILQDEPDPRF